MVFSALAAPFADQRRTRPPYGRDGKASGRRQDVPGDFGAAVRSLPRVIVVDGEVIMAMKLRAKLTKP